MPSPSEPGDTVPVPPAVRERLQEARRWARRRFDRGPVPVVISVALAGAIAGVVIGLLIADNHRQEAKSSRAQAERVHRPGTGLRATTHGPSSRPPSPPRRQSSPTAPPATPATPGADGGPASQPASASAASLNNRGFQLMTEGRYQDAIPLLRRAVSSAGNGGDLTYAYALYNLGRSLRLAGKPGEAIPLLERRLRIDNQRATVARELKAAQRNSQPTGGAR